MIKGNYNYLGVSSGTTFEDFLNVSMDEYSIYKDIDDEGVYFWTDLGGWVHIQEDEDGPTAITDKYSDQETDEILSALEDELNTVIIDYSVPMD